ncbi:MAG TPA: ECF-type sigma factor [Gemmataceae bacterium]|nr:ECF-type sigma factor [Gemmataceae bacterium]
MADDKLFQQLMEQLKAGDQESAGLVFNRYARRLIGLAASRLPAPVRAKEDPEDAVMSAFKSFFARQKKGEFQPEDWDELSTLLAYLTVCKVDRRIRKYLAGKRDVRRETAAAANEDGDSSGFQAPAPDPTPAEAAMLTDTVRELMARLDPVDQQILTLRLQGHTTAEIATAVGKSERTVFRVLEDIRDHVRHLVGKDQEKV